MNGINKYGHKAKAKFQTERSVKMPSNQEPKSKATLKSKCKHIICMGLCDREV